MAIVTVEFPLYGSHLVQRETRIVTSEVAIMNQRALVFAADSATTVSYYLPSGKRITRYFKGANKLFQLSATQPVGLMIYGSGSLHDVPWEVIIREFRRHLGSRACDKLATYSEQFFEFVRTHTGLFPDDTRRRGLLDAAFRAALRAWFEVKEGDAVPPPAAESPEASPVGEAAPVTAPPATASEGVAVTGAPDPTAPLRARIAHLLSQWRAAPAMEPLTVEDVAAAIAAHVSSVAERITSAVDAMGITDPALIPMLAEIAIHRVMKNFENSLESTGIVIGGYGESDYFPAFESHRCFGFLDTHFLYKREVGKAVSRESPAVMESFAIGSMIDTFRMGIGPETFQCVVEATSKTLKQFASTVRDAVAPMADIPHLDELVSDAARAHLDDWYGSSVLTHFSPLSRVIGALPVTDMAALARSLIELESLKERVTQESESVAGPIDVAAISKHDGFIWIERKHYFRPELNPRFFDRQHSHDRS